jgi:ligand-binding SRPBCC domain-containing protein
VYELLATTTIRAPIERVFDLARSVDAHLASTDGTAEAAVAGRTSGLLELGDTVTWRARHFGVTQHLTSLMTAFDRPHHFQDRMVRGVFRSFEHDHYFRQLADGEIEMFEVLRFAAPPPGLGWLVERLVLGPHFRRFLRTRNVILKRIAETDEWRNHLASSAVTSQCNTGASFPG